MLLRLGLQGLQVFVDHSCRTKRLMAVYAKTEGQKSQADCAVQLMQTSAALEHISHGRSVSMLQGVQASAEASREPEVTHQSGYTANGALAGHSADGREGALNPMVLRDLQKQLVKSRDEADEQLKQARWALLLLGHASVLSGSVFEPAFKRCRS